MSLQIGQPAPLFTTRDTEKNDVSLADFKGRPVVILFFPFAFTSVCTTELCSVRDHIADYNSVGAEVLAISVDSPFTLKQFKTEQNLNFILLSDFNKQIIKDYGCSYETFGGWMHGVARRSAFVADREGIIRYAEVLENAGELPNLQAVVDTLRSL